MDVHTGICFVLLLGVGCWNSVAAGPLSGHRVVRVFSGSTEAMNQLIEYLYNSTAIDVWRYPSNFDKSADIRLHPNEFDMTVTSLREAGYDVTILIEDIQHLVTSQKNMRKSQQSNAADFEYSEYHNLEEIYDWLENKTKFYPDRCSTVKVATSYENRPLKALKISTPSSASNRPALWIQGGIHAREWISPATVIYMAGKMLDYYNLDLELTKTVDKFVWYFLPVTNPDGYTYSWIGDEERLWRKTRSPQYFGYIGVDANRNWDFKWCETGASPFAWSGDYCGESPFSEPETKGVSNYILRKIENLRGFFDIHSFSQLWMSPWGYTGEFPEDFKLQNKGSRLAVKAIENVYGTRYEYGPVATTIYPSSGCSIDWAYGRAGIKYSYAIELRDTGFFGFLLPKEQIIPTGEETLEGLRVIANFISEN